MPGPETRPLFDLARELRIGFCWVTPNSRSRTDETHRYNTSVLVDKSGEMIAKYRKVHLPGHAEHEPWRKFQHLEKRYFEPGSGFGVSDAFSGVIGMAICNDRRWPETYRVMGLQGVEMVLIGYNTPVHNPPAPEHDDLSLFHNRLVMQAGAYQNGTWVVGVAKAGIEEGVDQIGGSCIVAHQARSSPPAPPKTTRSHSRAAISICATPTSGPHSTSTSIGSRTPTG